MITLKKVSEMKAAVSKAKTKGLTIGFVPTMGFLHEGHLSLVRGSRNSADVTVVSIFVNPLQFGPKEDLRQYPRDPDKDSQLLEREGVDYLFFPVEREMYPDGYKTTVEVADLQDKLCGRSRPGHFRGVTTVVLKLFHIVQPDLAFFGQKDAQQAAILQKMVKDLNLDAKIRILPIIRDQDGLALSSRNCYLDIKERQAALILIKSLREAEALFNAGEQKAAAIISRIRETIINEPLAKIDYVEIVDLGELEPVDTLDRDALVAVAVYIDKTRLIDNLILKAKVN